MKIPTSNESNKNFETPKIEEGLYTAKLLEVKEIKEGQYGKRVAWIYEILANQTKLAHITYVPEQANPENKFGKVLLAHGVDLGSEVETETLIGTNVRVMVEDYKNDDGEIASSITKVKTLAEKPEDNN